MGGGKANFRRLLAKRWENCRQTVMVKRIALRVTKVAAGIAAIVFWFTPLRTATQVLAFVASIVVLLICLGISGKFDDESTGYWPDKPDQS